MRMEKCEVKLLFAERGKRVVCMDGYTASGHFGCMQGWARNQERHNSIGVARNMEFTFMRLPERSELPLTVVFQAVSFRPRFTWIQGLMTCTMMMTAPPGSLVDVFPTRDRSRRRLCGGRTPSSAQRAARSIRVGNTASAAAASHSWKGGQQQRSAPRRVMFCCLCNGVCFRTIHSGVAC